MRRSWTSPFSRLLAPRRTARLPRPCARPSCSRSPCSSPGCSPSRRSGPPARIGSPRSGRSATTRPSRRTSCSSPPPKSSTICWRRPWPRWSEARAPRPTTRSRRRRRSPPRSSWCPPAPRARMPDGSSSRSTSGPAAWPPRAHPPPPALRDWLAPGGAARRRARHPPGAPERSHDRVALYRVKTIRYSGFAAHEAPLAAYGVVVCRSALAAVLSRALPRRPLLPPSVTGGIAERRAGGAGGAGPRRQACSGTPARPPAASTPAPRPSDSARGLTARAAFPPAVAARLALVEPRSRLPVLLLLLALTGGLGVIAFRQLRREQELARLRADFTSSVSHELRTPLTQILLYAETLELGRAAGEDERRQALGVIVQEARRLAHLVENVLQFSRAERRGTRVHPERRPLAPLVREIVERFAPLAGAAAVRLRTELDESVLAPVDADALTRSCSTCSTTPSSTAARGAVVLRPRLARCARTARGGGRRARDPAGDAGADLGALRPDRGSAPLGAGQRDRAGGGARAGPGARRRVPGGAAGGGRRAVRGRAARRRAGDRRAARTGAGGGPVARGPDRGGQPQPGPRAPDQPGVRGTSRPRSRPTARPACGGRGAASTTSSCST